MLSSGANWDKTTPPVCFNPLCPNGVSLLGRFCHLVTAFLVWWSVPKT